MAKQKRYFRYRVTAVGNNFKDRLKVGDVSIDTWHGKSHSYQTMNTDPEAEEWGLEFAYSVELIGEVFDSETLEKLANRRTTPA